MPCAPSCQSRSKFPTPSSNLNSSACRIRLVFGREHIMASGALPSAPPPVKIEGAYYWGGGIVSNTPLQYLLEQDEHQSSLVFQVDLFSARGTLPRQMSDVITRNKEIMNLSRHSKNKD